MTDNSVRTEVEANPYIRPEERKCVPVISEEPSQAPYDPYEGTQPVVDTITQKPEKSGRFEFPFEGRYKIKRHKHFPCGIYCHIPRNIYFLRQRGYKGLWCFVSCGTLYVLDLLVLRLP